MTLPTGTRTAGPDPGRARTPGPDPGRARTAGPDPGRARTADGGAAGNPTAGGGIERALRARGGKLLVPYLTAGFAPGWTDYLTAYAAAGADAIEVGLPFSDPMIDGSTIQEASDRALRRGVDVESLLTELAAVRHAVGVPLIAMTYYHLVQHPGLDAFCARLARAGVTGLIVPDLPLQETGPLRTAAGAHGVDLVLLAAPSTPDQRLDRIVGLSQGFVYAVSLMGTTGERAELAATGSRLAERITARTELPVLLGLGVSTAAHAVRAVRAADGVVIGSALMRQLLDGASPQQAGAWLAAVRAALDQEFGDVQETSG